MDIFFIFFNMKVYCVFSLELPRRGNSNENTQHTTGVIKFFSQPLVQDKWPVKIHLS